MTNTYAWIITRDHIEMGSLDLSGPSDAPSELLFQLHTGHGTPFRLHDDDGELYFAGRIVGDFTGFEPLDDFGTPAAGCTEIYYLNDTNSWQVL